MEDRGVAWVGANIAPAHEVIEADKYGLATNPLRDLHAEVRSEATDRVEKGAWPKFARLRNARDQHLADRRVSADAAAKKGHNLSRAEGERRGDAGGQGPQTAMVERSSLAVQPAILCRRDTDAAVQRLGRRQVGAER